MCLGIPMQVIESGLGQALCCDGARTHRIDTALVGSLEAGAWVMVFLGAARERISEATALQCRDALAALDIVMQGGSSADVEHLFADLIGREPELPDCLKPKTANAAGGSGETNSGDR